jgi:hypothetical protein
MDKRFDRDARKALEQAVGDGVRGRRTLATLESCVHTASQIKPEDAREKWEPYDAGDFIEHLERIIGLAEPLINEVFWVENDWPKYVQDLPFDRFRQSLIDVTALAQVQIAELRQMEAESRELVRRFAPGPGRPTFSRRRALAEMVGWALHREGYPLTSTPSSVLSNVLRTVLDFAGEKVPGDMSHLARFVIHRVESFRAKEQSEAAHNSDTAEK